MVFDIHEVGGIGEFITEEKTLGDGDDAERYYYMKLPLRSQRHFWS